MGKKAQDDGVQTVVVPARCVAKAILGLPQCSSKPASRIASSKRSRTATLGLCNEQNPQGIVPWGFSVAWVSQHRSRPSPRPRERSARCCPD